MLKKLAEEDQKKTELQQNKKMYLFRDSIRQSSDIASIYIDKSNIPTEIIRTPVFESDTANNYNYLTLSKINSPKKNSKSGSRSPSKNQWAS